MAADTVRVALVAVWALAAVVLLLRRHTRLGVVVAGAAAVSGLCAATASSEDLAWVHALAACTIPAVALHLELLIPDGDIGSRGRRTLALVGYGAGLAT